MKKMRCNLNRREKNEFLTKKSAGFTFVETLAVLAVAAVLTASASVSAVRVMDMARHYAAKEDIVQFKSALQAYSIDCGTFPTTEQGLSALWKKPSLVPIPSGWNGPYLDREIPKDPWGNEYQYARKESTLFPAECNPALPYAIFSFASDGAKGGSGAGEDIVSWK